MSIRDNIAAIEERKRQAAERSGRRAEDVLLIAVTKLHTPEEINEAIDCGITDIGENKVQEILEKYDRVKPVRWHLIGHLQTNKVKYIIDKVDLIHSVDSLHLAKEIEKRAAQHDKVMDILVQVNAAEEESKFGIGAEETDQLIQAICEQCPHIRIKGLMCIAPLTDDVEEARPFFAEVKAIYDRYRGDKSGKTDFQVLSMGMSNDFEVAVEEGANAIRVGTAIFGARNYRQEEK
ncbi:MAG: YggS family pyridoxal phosphate-dependent enzyme [Firmicutes bacterium]|nr:YggS family pyridoxal phosphate-dependent enzyme [Bacillota bacterium]MCR4711455.1 YggS family pyridoxal phosphate-dependent enzyme [Clostridia bacterium]